MIQIISLLTFITLLCPITCQPVRRSDCQTSYRKCVQFVSCVVCMCIRWSAGRWPVNEWSKPFEGWGGRCISCIYSERPALSSEIQNCLVQCERWNKWKGDVGSQTGQPLNILTTTSLGWLSSLPFDSPRSLLHASPKLHYLLWYLTKRGEKKGNNILGVYFWRCCDGG